MMHPASASLNTSATRSATLLKRICERDNPRPVSRLKNCVPFSISSDRRHMRVRTLARTGVRRHDNVYGTSATLCLYTSFTDETPAARLGLLIMAAVRFTLSSAIALLFLASCAAPRSQMNKLEPGMTKAQVVSILGEPDSSRLRRDDQCLMYSLWRDFWNRRLGDYSDRYYVCFTEGRLSSYGRVGDEF
jgi:hypothetical protein